MTIDRAPVVPLADLAQCGLVPDGDARFVTIFEIDCDAAKGSEKRLQQSLDAREHAQLSRLRHPLSRRRRMVLRGALRAILGAHLHLSPERVPLTRTAEGRPRLEGLPGRVALGFSCSSRDGHGAVVVASSETVGIDLERVTRARFADHLAIDMLHEREMALLAALPAALRPSWLAAAWVTKEAILKAIGCGLAVDPRSLDVVGTDSDGWLERDESRVFHAAQLQCWRYRRNDVVMALASDPGAPTPRRVVLAL